MITVAGQHLAAEHGAVLETRAHGRGPALGRKPAWRCPCSRAVGEGEGIEEGGTVGIQ